jgi:hypothetical protein
MAKKVSKKKTSPKSCKTKKSCEPVVENSVTEIKKLSSFQRVLSFFGLS